VFWAQGDGFSEENSCHSRIGHNTWREICLELPTSEQIQHLRIDFLSPLTTIEIEAISVTSINGDFLFEANDLEQVRLLGDCRKISAHPFILQVTGVDPQLHLPQFTASGFKGPVAVRMRLRVASDTSKTDE
jgi:hypothetical protein